MLMVILQPLSGCRDRLFLHIATTHNTNFAVGEQFKICIVSMADANENGELSDCNCQDGVIMCRPTERKIMVVRLSSPGARITLSSIFTNADSGMLSSRLGSSVMPSTS